MTWHSNRTCNITRDIRYPFTTIFDVTKRDRTGMRIANVMTYSKHHSLKYCRRTNQISDLLVEHRNKTEQRKICACPMRYRSMSLFSFSCSIGHQPFQPKLSLFKLSQKNTFHVRFGFNRIDADEKISNQLYIFSPARQGKHKSYRS